MKPILADDWKLVSNLANDSCTASCEVEKSTMRNRQKVCVLCAESLSGDGCLAWDSFCSFTSLLMVTTWSATRRNSFALGRVVSILWCTSSCDTMVLYAEILKHHSYDKLNCQLTLTWKRLAHYLSIDHLWAEGLPSFLKLLPCFMRPQDDASMDLCPSLPWSHFASQRSFDQPYRSPWWRV